VNSFIQLFWQPFWESNEVEIESEFLYQIISLDATWRLLGVDQISDPKCPFALTDEDHYIAFARALFQCLELTNLESCLMVIPI
jgi:hypothetical protein